MTDHNKDSQKITPNFSLEQWRYIAASLENPQMSKKDLAEYIGVPADTVYGWTRKDKTLDEYIEQSLIQSVQMAQDLLSQVLMKAMLVKVAGLDDPDSNIRQRVATEIIERVMGKAAQRTEHTGADGGAIQTQSTNVNIQADNVHDAGNILAQLAELGAIPQSPSEGADDTTPE